VNTLSPGAIDTPIIDGQFKSKEEADKRQSIFLRDNAARSYWAVRRDGVGHLFLASDASSYSTGLDLVVVGGIAQV